MTVQEAIETIKYASAFNADNSPLTEALDMAIEALEKQLKSKWIPTVEAKLVEWIPCSEGLPSAGREVLLQTKGNQMVVAFLDKKNKWYVDSGDYFCTDLCAEPIAWRPLPEPYREDDES